MRLVPFLLSAGITVLLILAFNTSLVLPAPLGKLLSPQHGVWQNADPADEDYNASLVLPGLKGKTEVYFDDRLVPHVFAEYDEDAFFVQGYLHARFRLWQMDFQTRVAAGRLSEVLGDKNGLKDILNRVDRYFRRLGLPYAAERSLKLIEADSATKMFCDSYTAGVNAYIKSLTESSMPLEYKLLGFQPEPWSNGKTALFLKFMSFDLAGYEKDFEYTAARNAFTKELFDQLYPDYQGFVDPVVPKGTVFDQPGIVPVKPADADSIYFNYKKAGNALPGEPLKPDRENGSNNWAVGPAKSKSGHPILCNDPHLGLNLPSLWYEIQLQTPRFNVYGASFPCSPGVAIGFNDSCAFGFTNAGRDVRDYYAIRFKDDTRKQYWFNGSWKDTELRIERFKVKNKPDVLDTVAYTVFGPVLFDKNYTGGRVTNGESYAVRWKAHDPSNEVKVFYLLNRARNYNDYLTAIKNFHTPGQNCIFAAKNGDIALWAQGEFPAKWKRQGEFVMPGYDSSYMWQGMIPQAENPHQLNPERGFVSSANQYPADSSYPYYMGGSFAPYRGLYINQRLSAMQQVTLQDMMKLQTDNYNVLAGSVLPHMLKAVDESKLLEGQKQYWNTLKSWSGYNNPQEEGPTIFDILFDSLHAVVYEDELAGVEHVPAPYESVLAEGIVQDSAYRFFDDIRTPRKETLQDDVMEALRRAMPVLEKARTSNSLKWYQFKDTHINHLLALPSFSRQHINTGGGTYSVNATRDDHGPSWRMIVHLSPEIEAYGVYPGGQNGDPGSMYYDNFIGTWQQGRYYRLWFMKKQEAQSNRIKWKMTFDRG
ncbi:MAG: penicillin acylase family protein [Williamsia sp.]|nr:penicillin acylase family protein [Williamsia sp.]